MLVNFVKYLYKQYKLIKWRDEILKKFITVILSLTIAVCASFSGIAFANPKLSGHWAEDMIEDGFIEKHFPNFAENNFEKFIPNGEISYQDFKQSLSSILRELGYVNKKTDENLEGNLTRKKAAIIIADELFKHKIVDKNQNLKNPFKDLKDLDKEQTEKIVLLHDLDILKGVTKTVFVPDDKVTQIQAVIMLQRVRNLISNNQKDIPFKVIDENKSFSSVEAGITVDERDDKVIVSVVEKLPNPGYSIKIDKIKKQGDIYNIYINVEEPEPGKIYNQVITYYNIILEISKDDLANPPYSFKMKGKQLMVDEVPLGDDWKIEPEEVKTIELFSLEGEKIMQFKDDDIKDIVKSFNKSKVDNRAYIEMLVGNSMVIQTKDCKIRITSYGSDTNIVASREKDGRYTTKHLVCPEIAELLLKTIK